MLESATMAYLVGLFLAFLGLSGLVVCLGIFAARMRDHMTEWDELEDYP